MRTDKNKWQKYQKLKQGEGRRKVNKFYSPVNKESSNKFRDKTTEKNENEKEGMRGGKSTEKDIKLDKRRKE